VIKGSLPADILGAALDALPLDVTVIDADDRVLAWNKHETRRFKRGPSVLGRDVRSCHRPESLPMVESVLSRLRSGETDRVEFRIDRGEPENVTIWVVYWALRDKDGKYLGCMETDQTIRKGET
jgi:DUF438 domain-containing protein